MFKKIILYLVILCILFFMCFSFVRFYFFEDYYLSKGEIDTEEMVLILAKDAPKCPNTGCEQ